MIKLATETIDNKDIDSLIKWLGTYPRLTKGPLTEEYEAAWSKYLGVENSLFVNSGSSAVMLMLATLLEAKKINIGDEVIVPALSWATDVSSVVNLGLVPVLCDCNLIDLSLDIKDLNRIINSPRETPRVIIVVPVLGLVPDMAKLKELCNKNNIIMLEDCCEALGSEYDGKKLGTFGEMSAFSTYFGHHISTIEGGMVCTDNYNYSQILKSIRSHGWDRDLDKTTKERYRKYWDVSEFNSLYTFYHSGFNVRATDLQAFLGIGQLKKLDKINKARNKNFKLYLKHLDMGSLYCRPGCFVSNFAFPIVNTKRDAIVEALEKNNVEVRPLICGSMGQQPFFIRRYSETKLENADLLRAFGMYLPNHHLITEADVKSVCEIVNSV